MNSMVALVFLPISRADITKKLGQHSFDGSGSFQSVQSPEFVQRR